MSILLKRVSFSYSTDELQLINLQLTLQSGEKVGLVGENGVGKSTLAKLMAGLLEPTSGIIEGSHLVFYFEQTRILDDFSATMTGTEFLGDFWGRLQGEDLVLASELLADIHLETSCAQLSGGEWTRLRLVQALSSGAEFLIFDEPTNHLDRTTRNIFYQFIARLRRGVLIISHDQELLRHVDKIIELTNKGLNLYGGNIDVYLVQREIERAALMSDYDRLKNEKEHLGHSLQMKRERQRKRMRQGAESVASSGLPRILIGARKRQAQQTYGKVVNETSESLNKKQIELKLKADELKKSQKIYFRQEAIQLPPGKMVFEMENLQLQWSSFVKPFWSQPLTGLFRGPCRVAVTGDNGSGKSTLLKLLSGEEIENLKVQGHWRRGDVPLGRLDQEGRNIEGRLSVLENVRAHCAVEEGEVRHHLAEFLFFGDQVFKRTKDLSGGERMRLLLAIISLKNPFPQCLILDEPTNNLDFLAVDFLIDFLNEYQGALFIASHDEDFLQRIQIDHEIRLLKLI